MPRKSVRYILISIVIERRTIHAAIYTCLQCSEGNVVTAISLFCAITGTLPRAGAAGFVCGSTSLEISSQTVCLKLSNLKHAFIIVTVILSLKRFNYSVR